MTVDEPSAAGDGRRLAGMLGEARERGFVGRDLELGSFAGSLKGAPARLHLVHGTGGIGKTTLLDALARVAGRHGRTVTHLDARELACSADAVLAALGDGTADVLLVDDYQLLEPLDAWFREQLLPSRPADGVTVLAGRAPPRPEWLLDPGWRQLVRVHELAGFDSAESAELLALLGVAEPDREPMARLARGHPLALAMLAEAAAGGVAPAELRDAPDVVGRLCRLIIDDIPDAAHRTGLATCAHATRMTHDLLVHMIESRADEVWAWLESRPYVRRGTVGLFVHDVVREIFEAEFVQRAPDAYASLHRRMREYFLRRLVDPHEVHPDRAAAEILMLHRHGPLSEYAAMLREGGLLPISHAASHDHEAIVRLVEDGEGADSAALARRWINAQPSGVYTGRSDTGVLAFATQIYLPAAAGLVDDDPVAAAIMSVVEQHGPLRPGERINVNRFSGASGPYQRHPLVLLVNGVSCILEWSLERAAWTFIATIEADLYGRYFEYLGLSPMFSLDYFGHNLVGYGWDRRRFPPSALFELLARRELSGETGPPPASMLRPPPLAHDAFAAAVREALIHVSRPDRLAESPLLGSSLVGPEASDSVEQLRRVLLASVAALSSEPRGADHRRVLTRTYLKGASSQESAAELLGLAFSTYRRHLARAQERLVEVLWSVEIGARRLPVPESPESPVDRS